MDKRRLQRTWMRVRHIKPWVFLIIAVVCGTVSVYAMRQNNLHMVQLREAVYQADKDNGDVEAALRNLRTYIYGHMNTSLESTNSVYPPIQLQHTYERLTAARQAGATAAASSNEELYNQAQKYCEQAIPNGFSGSYRLSCIQAFVKERSLSPNAVEAIPKNLYQFDFVSAKWSPDLAGWSLLTAIFFFLLGIGLFIYQNVIRWIIRR
jgi:hypothetical protein